MYGGWRYARTVELLRGLCVFSHHHRHHHHPCAYKTDRRVRFVVRVNSLNANDKTRRTYPREGLAVRPDLINRASCSPVYVAAPHKSRSPCTEGSYSNLSAVPARTLSPQPVRTRDRSRAANALGVFTLMTGTSGAKLITLPSVA